MGAHFPREQRILGEESGGVRNADNSITSKTHLSLGPVWPCKGLPYRQHHHWGRRGAQVPEMLAKISLIPISMYWGTCHQMDKDAAS